MNRKTITVFFKHRIKQQKLHITTATLADIPLIRQLTMQVWPQTYIPIVGEEQVNYMLGRFYSPESLTKQMQDGHTFIIGYDGGQPVAFASYSEILPQVYKLHKLYIITTQQGKGTGRAMVDHIAATLGALGAKELRLNVNRYNTPARNFYAKTGFQQIAEEDIDIGDGYFMNDYVLSLPLM